VTEIDFYTHVGDRLGVAARLAAKAYARGLSVRLLTAGEADTEALDGLLWRSPAVGFLPHCRLGARVAARTPIWVDHLAEHEGPAQVLVNLTAAIPPFFSRFDRLAEIVTLDEADRVAGRERYRAYRDRGYAVRSHNLGQVS
jgi:DNA polymerase-3 subunit chi